MRPRNSTKNKVLLMLPVELTSYTWGPFYVGSDTTYMADGSDWKRSWHFGIRGLGAVSIHLPAWMLNALTKRKILRDIRLTPRLVDELREENQAICAKTEKLAIEAADKARLH